MYTGPEQLAKRAKIDALMQVIVALDLTGPEVADAIWEAKDHAVNKQTAMGWYHDVRDSLSPWGES